MANPAGVLRGVDVSHHQDDIDVGRLPVDFVIARTVQAAGGKYATTRDRAYATHKANAARDGKLFSSYCYLGNGISAAANAALHADIEPDRSVPVMLDWEQGSGNGAFLRACENEFAKAGFFVWGKYAPRWYWQSQGSPDLSGAAPLVSSRYADTAPGDWESEYRGTPDSYWAPYGGNVVRMLQFSSVGRLQPYPNRDLDLDAFQGTRAQLAAWWNPKLPNPQPAPGELDHEGELMERITVTPPNADQNAKRVWLSGSPNAAVIVRPRINRDGVAKPMWVGDIFAWGNDHQGVGHNPKTVPGYVDKLTSHRRYELPGAVWADINYSAAQPFEIDIVG
ncbi:hypothetical protein [Amycolatopsis sp. NPDC049159]|uniref:hypothetical protein n=1 Tax=Amycolatopsis sp. NPDC049159 TaxID=3157210 RepID=UPI0033C448A0